MSFQAPRVYYPIWEKLKADGTVSITANRLLHPRIIKAVKKEKWMDIMYKADLAPDFPVLSHSISHSVITFTLTIKKSTGIVDLRRFGKPLSDLLK